MGLVRGFWLAMNGRRTYYELKDTFDFCKNLANILEEFTEWRKEAGKNDQQFLTKECYDDVASICKAVPAFIASVFNDEKLKDVRPQFTPRLITQDMLEKDFGELRQRCGGSTNPVIQTVANVLRSMNINRLLQFARSTQ